MSLKSYPLCARMRAVPGCPGEKHRAGSTEINILNTVALHDLKLAFGC